MVNQGVRTLSDAHPGFVSQVRDLQPTQIDDIVARGVRAFDSVRVVVDEMEQGTRAVLDQARAKIQEAAEVSLRGDASPIPTTTESTRATPTTGTNGTSAPGAGAADPKTEPKQATPPAAMPTT